MHLDLLFSYHKSPRQSCNDAGWLLLYLFNLLFRSDLKPINKPSWLKYSWIKWLICDMTLKAVYRHLTLSPFQWLMYFVGHFSSAAEAGTVSDCKWTHHKASAKSHHSSAFLVTQLRFVQAPWERDLDAGGRHRRESGKPLNATQDNYRDRWTPLTADLF